MIRKATQTSKAEISVDDDGIVYISFLENHISFGREDAIDLHLAQKRINKDNRPLKVLIDFRTSPKINIGARKYAETAEVQKETRAIAMIVSGPVSQIIGNFFLGLNKGAYPVRLFQNKELALKWLHELN